MSWFKKAQPKTISAPFSVERVAMLATVIFPLAIQRGLKLRQNGNATYDDVWNSRFFNSYVVGYCTRLDDYDENLGSSIRAGLLKALFEPTDFVAQNRFNLTVALAQSDDQPTRLALESGERDGTAYFNALLEQRDATEDATTQLVLAVRQLEQFDPLIP